MQATMADEKHALLPGVNTQPSPRADGRMSWKARLAFAALGAFGWYQLDTGLQQGRIIKHGRQRHSEWGSFPQKDDPFHFLPCTNATVPPGLHEPHPLESWNRLYDPDPSHWSRGNSSQSLYLCGWLDVPLDYTNTSDERVARLAVTKLQHAPKRSNRTKIGRAHV